jgi:hypothetical protein
VRIIDHHAGGKGILEGGLVSGTRRQAGRLRWSGRGHGPQGTLGKRRAACTWGT